MQGTTLRASKIMAALRAVTVLLVAFTATASSAATCPGADSEALAWLEKMSNSLHQVSYHGVVTFQRGEDMQVMQVSHSVDGDRSSETLTRLTGQGAQVMRADHPLECVHPGHKMLRVGIDLQEGRCGIDEHYRFSVEKGERVAGRKTVKVRIRPLDMYRFGYVMELDRKTGLLLKTETLGRGEKVLEKFQFASLSYSGAGQEVQVVDLVHEAEHPHPDVASTASGSSRAWFINWLPRGFAATDQPAPGVSRRTYTDGLAVFSVFLEELGADIRPGEGVARSGGTVSYTRGLQLSGQSVLVTVIGEVPVNTARMVADSIAWAP